MTGAEEWCARRESPFLYRSGRIDSAHQIVRELMGKYTWQSQAIIYFYEDKSAAIFIWSRKEDIFEAFDSLEVLAKKHSRRKVVKECLGSIVRDRRKGVAERRKGVTNDQI